MDIYTCFNRSNEEPRGNSTPLKVRKQLHEPQEEKHPDQTQRSGAGDKQNFVASVCHPRVLEEERGGGVELCPFRVSRGSNLIMTEC